VGVGKTLEEEEESGKVEEGTDSPWYFYCFSAGKASSALILKKISCS